MEIPYSPLCRRAVKWIRRWFMCAALLAIAGTPIAAFGAEELNLLDQGHRRTFEVAEDEALVSKWGTAKRELTTQLSEKLPSVSVIQSYGAQLLVKLPAAIDRDRAPAAIPGSEWKLVIYLKGAEHKTANRRVITREVEVQLPEGMSAEDFRVRAGAEKVRLTKGGRVLLQFPTPRRAVDAAAVLSAGGTNAEVVLGRVYERFAAPNDPFFNRQWHLRNTGQSGSVPNVDVNILNAWDITKASGVNVVVVDDSMQVQASDAMPGTGHEDLVANTKPVDSGLHFDFRDGDSDPNPGDINDAHGTAVSGVLAARGDNSIGVSGSAPQASLVGVRTIGSFVTDADIADAVTWSPPTYTAHVSNNSWGYTGAPALRDVGFTITQALQDAATTGRDGKGQITLFANGNSQQEDDNGNYTTLANSRFVIAVGAIDNLGHQSFYSNPGANLLISAPSNGGTLGIFTTDVTGDLGYNPNFGLPGEPANVNYTANFGGTSSATPLTSGCVALILGANPNLGWRDVHEILAQTARKIDPADSDWADNGAGFHFNHKYGAGIVDATAAVILGRDWQNLGAETSVTKSLTSPAVPAAVPDNDNTGISRDLDFSDVQNVRAERVEAKVRITTGNRSDLEVSLVSPSGKRSILSPVHARPDFNQTGDDDNDFDTFDGTGWPFTTTHHWGENSQGIWKIQVRDLRSGTTATMTAARITIFGTAAPTQRFRFTQHRSTTLESSTDPALIRVERLGDPVGEVSVDWAISDAQFNGRAILGTDFNATPGTLVFADGETFKDIPITLIDNATEEGNRSLYIVLKNPVGGALGGFVLHRLDIVDDESNLVSVAPGDVDMKESSGIPNPGTFIVSRSKATDQPLFVNLSSSGTATSGIDYQALPTAVTIPANATSATVTVTPIDDLDLESVESVILNVEAGDGYGVGVPGSAQLSLVDNDQPLVNVVAVDNSATEAGLTTGMFRITRNHPLTGNPLALPSAMVVNLSIGGTATPGENYQPIQPFAVIPENADHVDIMVTPIDDSVYKNPQTVVVRLAPSFEYGRGFSTEDVVEIANNEPLPDPIPPTVVITAPSQGLSVNAPNQVMATGTASDNQQVTKVLYQVNEGPFLPVAGTNSWQIDLTPSITPGPNVLRVKALDNYDNVSEVVTREFSYVSPRTLTVQIDGNGKVSKGFSPSSTRNAGFTFSITATPAKGFVFAGWSGITTSSLKTYTFVMPDANTTLTARFIADPFGPAIAGSYEGLLQNQAQFTLSASGFVKLKVGATGAFSGSLIYGGVKLPMKGQFTGDQPVAGSGRFVGQVKRKKPLLPLMVDLQIDTEGDTNRITGTVATFEESSVVIADRAAFNKKTNPYQPAASKPQLFTIRFPAPEPIVGATPNGDGFATASIDANGTVKWTGQLPDGTKVSQSTKLSKTLTFPLFVNLYKGDGVILGPVALDSAPTDSDLAGTLDWFKKPRQDKLFQGGFFANDTGVVGSIYQPPIRPGLVLSSLSAGGTMEFRRGNLNVNASVKEFDATIQVQPGNKVTVTGANPQLVVTKISASKGAFNGTFKHPQTGIKTPFGGVFLQKTQIGTGGFIGSSPNVGTPIQTGTVKIIPNP
jgi:subtilisin-like proprotein convertase family protein